MTPPQETLYPENPEKVCVECKLSKPLSSFGKGKKNKDGRLSTCRDCLKARKLTTQSADKVAPLFKICSKKTCRYAGQPQPVDNFYKINPRYKYKDNLDSQCKSCRSDYGKQLHAQLKNREHPKEESRVCSKCGGGPQPIANFSNNSSKRGGKSTICKSCAKVQQQKWRAAHLEEQLAKQKEYYQKERDKNLEWAKAKKFRDFGVDREWYETTLAAQGGGCAICGSTDPRGFGKRFAIDHDHKCCPPQKGCSECRRGLLCFSCNTKLSSIESDWILKAISYLKKYGSNLSHIFND